MNKKEKEAITKKEIHTKENYKRKKKVFKKKRKKETKNKNKQKKDNNKKKGELFKEAIKNTKKKTTKILKKSF